MKTWVSAVFNLKTFLTVTQTTQEVEKAIKQGLPAERPVSPLLLAVCLNLRPRRFMVHAAIENRDTSQ